MRRGLILVIGIAVSAWCVGAATPAHAEKSLQVVAVQVESGKLDDYLARVAKLRGVMERLGIQATMRVWQATAAGPNTGMIIVGLEYADLAGYAAATTKLAADAEWNKLIAGLDGIRTVVGNSLYREVTP